MLALFKKSRIANNFLLGYGSTRDSSHLGTNLMQTYNTAGNSEIMYYVSGEGMAS